MNGTETAKERAGSFVRLHGDALAQGRAQVLCTGGGADAVISALDEPDPVDPASLLRALSVCDELRALRAPLSQRCCAALSHIQAEDGGFGDSTRPDEERLPLTGRLGGLLARSPFARPETLDGIGGFLAERFTPDLLQGFQYDNLAACAHYFANALHDASDEILQWCGRELERGFRAREFDALATGHVLALCDAHALPGARLSREELLVGLMTEQGSDGSFGSAQTPSGRVEPTLRGLRVLHFLAAGQARVDSPAAAR